MLSLGALAFLNPWLLAALAALPVLWFLLRAIPPGPARLRFPGVRLLLGLIDPERTPERTPWWLLLLRVLAVAAAILGFADPVLNPRQPILGTGPVVIAMDGGWAQAPGWTAAQARVRELLEQAGRAGRPVALLVLSEPPPPEARLDLRPAADWAGRVGALQPKPWDPDRAGWAAWIATAGADGVESWWLHDGLGASGEDFAAALAALGPLTMIGPDRLALAIRPAAIADGALEATVIRADAGEPRLVQLQAIGADPAGRERRLAVADAAFAADATEAAVRFDLPLEVRNRVARIALGTEASAGGVTLTDEAVKRRKVGLIAGAPDREGAQLVSPLHYLRQALKPTAELVEAPLADLLAASPDVIVLADVGTFAPEERAGLTAWVEAGGLLVRFAGPRLAAAHAGSEDDPLLPVRLREGGRDLAGALSWGTPRTLRPFPPTSPFAGLPVPDEVTVTRQVMAQPDPDLPDRTLAALEDGTPLVTERPLGDGRVVLFHVTANADWSNLPISGLYVQMLERLAISARAGAPDAGDLAGAVWTPVMVLDGFGQPQQPGALAGVPGARLAEGRAGPDAPPGIWQAGERTAAINLVGPGTVLAAMGPPPAGVTVERLGVTTETVLKQWFLVAAFLLLAVDLLAALWLSGRLRGIAARAAGAIAAAVLLLAPAPGRADEAADLRAIEATRDSVLAYVRTGDARLDRVSEAGLAGLSRILTDRTAIEPGPPMAVSIENDELAFFPMLYWPVSEGQATPSPAAYAKLNAYLRSGGMIVFDTRDANLGAGFGTGTPNGKALQRIAAGLDIPPLEPLPEDHVLTRTFYLLQSFPGRYAEGEVWVEAAQQVEMVEGMPFRNLNDGVTPVVIGSNDWAAAWAMDEAGRPLFPVGRSLGSDRQREMAWRFGVNLVMHVMTGNYKSDQVHVPALLERLGQ
jgi:hypothetical protein